MRQARYSCSIWPSRSPLGSRISTRDFRARRCSPYAHRLRDGISTLRKSSRLLRCPPLAYKASSSAPVPIQFLFPRIQTSFNNAHRLFRISCHFERSRFRRDCHADSVSQVRPRAHDVVPSSPRLTRRLAVGDPWSPSLRTAPASPRRSMTLRRRRRLTRTSQSRRAARSRPRATMRPSPATSRRPLVIVDDCTSTMHATSTSYIPDPTITTTTTDYAATVTVTVTWDGR